MKKKIVTVLFTSALALSITACSGNSASDSTDEPQASEETIQEDESEESDETQDESELSQSEWMEQHAGDYEDGYEVVDAINIDSGDTKLEYVSNEEYVLESGGEILLVNFTFSNVSAGTTNLDSQYNFKAFQDGVEVTVYSSLYDEIEGDSNRRKEILDGASIDVSIGIAPDNWESPVKLRVDDSMMYDDAENMGYTFQQQEIDLQ